MRLAAKKFRINGIELAPAKKTIEWGRKIVDYRAEPGCPGTRLRFALRAKFGSPRSSSRM